MRCFQTVASSRRVATACVALAIAGCSAGGNSFSPGARDRTLSLDSGSSGQPIQHIVLMVQENRSFDNFFATYPGADGATYGYNSKGKKIPLVKADLAAADVNHDWSTFLAECDLQPSGACKMDGFDKAKIGGNNPGGNYAYRYVDPNQIQAYWTIAQQYVLLDHLFQTQGSGSFTAHQDLIAGGTAIDSNNSLVDYPNEAQVWGCDAPQGTVTSLITVNDTYKHWEGPFPCLDYPSGTMRDLFDAAGVTWKYYTPPYKTQKSRGGAGSEWNAFAVIKSVRYGPEWKTNISIPETNICGDIASGNLPAFSWVIPDQVDSDHPHSKDQIDTGPDWIASVVNAIGKSQYWNSTAIIILWDDWGGFYDNVAPKFYGSGSLGFRVPGLVVSPYVHQGKIAHSVFEFGSILKFAEQTFGLGSLGTSDKRATSLAQVFDFKQKARAFTPISTKRSCQYFMHRAPSYLPVDTQ